MSSDGKPSTKQEKSQPQTFQELTKIMLSDEASSSYPEIETRISHLFSLMLVYTFSQDFAVVKKLVDKLDTEMATDEYDQSELDEETYKNLQEAIKYLKATDNNAAKPSLEILKDIAKMLEQDLGISEHKEIRVQT